MDIFTRFLLTCLLFVHVSAEKCLLFKMNSVKTAAVGTDSKSKIYFECDLIFNQLPDHFDNFQLATSYDVSIRSLNISVQGGSSNPINLADCPSFDKIRKELNEPFHVTYLNGLFKELHVPRNNENLSTNLKLLISRILQAKISELLGFQSQFHTTTIQDTLYGSCSLNYDGLRSLSYSQAVFNFSKTFNMNSCSNINRTILSKSPLIKICNPINKTHLQFDRKENLTVVVNSDLRTIIDLSLKQDLRYNPWINSPIEMDHNIRTNITFKSFVNDSVLFNVPKGTYEIVTNIKYTEPDSSLVNIKIRNPLQRTYSALACNPYNTNIDLEIYKHAIKGRKYRS